MPHVHIIQKSKNRNRKENEYGGYEGKKLFQKEWPVWYQSKKER
jgi:hypothetical protein